MSFSGFSPTGEANSAPPNPLPGFEGPLRGRRNKGRKGKKEGDGRDAGETGRNPHPKKCLVTALCATNEYWSLVMMTSVQLTSADTLQHCYCTVPVLYGPQDTTAV